MGWEYEGKGSGIQGDNVKYLLVAPLLYIHVHVSPA